jgi:hypothetical protein
MAERHPLERVHLFRDLAEEQRKTLIASCEHMKFDPGATIFEGDPAGGSTSSRKGRWTS